MTSSSLAVRPSGLWHFLQHQAIRYRSSWTSTVVTAVASPVFFLLAVGFGLGSQVDGASLPTEDYVSYIGPGVLGAVAMTQGGGLSLWPTMAALKWEGTYQAVLATPLTPTELATGHIAWIGVRAAVMGALYVAVLTVFGVTASPLALLAPLAAAATSMAVAGPLSAFAATRESDSSFSLILRLGLTPMFLFSGAFFPIEQLPAGVRWISWVVPAWHGVELCRGLITGLGSAIELAGHLGYLVAFIVAGWYLASRAFTSRLAS